MNVWLKVFQSRKAFFYPLLIWFLAGGILLFVYDKATLFWGLHIYHSHTLDVLFTGITYLGDFYPFGLLLLYFLIQKAYPKLFIGMGILALVTLVIQYIKHELNMPRPSVYFDDSFPFKLVSWIELRTQWSFPSGHTATGFAFFTYGALLVKKPLWQGIFLVLALLVAYSRIYLYQHFFSDVYIGSLIGFFIAYFLYTYFYKYRLSL
jgi:membrane-associated phospholipid phosphatase